MESVIAVENLSKTYKSGHPALQNINLQIRKCEIFALLGPNGAGKTTLISIICGIVNPGAGRVRVAGFDIKADYRAARSAIGLVPQELVNDVFETVWATVRFSRGLFGKKPDPQYLEQLLKDLSLWDKRDAKIFELSGGMKRRVMIAKALSHEPSILFLDEPTVALDPQVRRRIWTLVRKMKAAGVTVFVVTRVGGVVGASTCALLAASGALRNWPTARAPKTTTITATAINASLPGPEPNVAARLRRFKSASCLRAVGAAAGAAAVSLL